MVKIIFLFIPAKITNAIAKIFIMKLTITSQKKSCIRFFKKSNSNIIIINVNKTKASCVIINFIDIAHKESLTRKPFLLSSYACIG